MRGAKSCVSVLVTVIIALAAVGVAAAASADEAVQLLVAWHWVDCHTARQAAQGLVLAATKLREPAAAFSDLKLLKHIADRVRSHSMPPTDAAVPLAYVDRQSLLNWLDARIDQSVGDWNDPGTIPIRRLTRPEYRNTIRDLLGPDLTAADIDTATFSSDDIAHGFDDLADVNSLSPLLMDRYVDAACSLGEAWAKTARPRRRAARRRGRCPGPRGDSAHVSRRSGVPAVAFAG